MISSFRRFTLFVEGGDDQRFANSILRPLLEPVCDYLEIYQYAQKRPPDVRRYIRSLDRIPDANYLFIADFDQGPCVTLRKSRLINRYGSLEPERILIVRREIESWYMAGLDSDSYEEFRLPTRRNTDGITKEQFDSLVPSRFEDRTDFMVEILNRYDKGAARRRNTSFDYAMGKYFGAIA